MVTDFSSASRSLRNRPLTIAHLQQLKCGQPFVGNNVSQSEIANYVGCTTNGTSGPAIVSGVDHFTTTHDAFYDTDTNTTDFFSRQITSINNSTPLVAAILGVHVGVINGGSWHIDDDSGLNVWDFVYFHDPEAGPNRVYVASDWMIGNTAEVIGGQASAEAAANLAEYGSSVAVRGSTYRVPIAD
jgi:hypothetical protein